MAVIPRFGRVLFVLLRFFSFLPKSLSQIFCRTKIFCNPFPKFANMVKKTLFLISEQSCFADFPVSFRTVLAQYISQAFLYLQFEIFCGVFHEPLNIRRYPLFRNNLESGVSLLRRTCSLVLTGFVPPNKVVVPKGCVKQPFLLSLISRAFCFLLFLPVF